MAIPIPRAPQSDPKQTNPGESKTQTRQLLLRAGLFPSPQTSKDIPYASHLLMEPRLPHGAITALLPQTRKMRRRRQGLIEPIPGLLELGAQIADAALLRRAVPMIVPGPVPNPGRSLRLGLRSASYFGDRVSAVAGGHVAALVRRLWIRRGGGGSRRDGRGGAGFVLVGVWLVVWWFAAVGVRVGDHDLAGLFGLALGFAAEFGKDALETTGFGG